MTISLRKARTIIRKALEKGREMELNPLVGGGTGCRWSCAGV